MMNTRRMLVALALAVMAFAAQRPALAQSREESKLLSATRVLEELRAQRDQAIPERLLQRAYGVAVIPSVRKVAFVLGGRGGRGVLTVRDSRGRFSNPVFITLAGGSVGWQIGAQETDVVLVFTTRRGIEGIADGKLTLGAGASAAAGPVGRQAEVAAGVNAEVFSYSRARGLFAGVALDGTSISIDNKGNGYFYNKRGVLTSDILSGAVGTSSENARRFLAAVAASTGESASAPTAAPAAPAAPAGTPGPAPAAPAAGGVKTFPMEDPAPGKEPR
ncbi:MAG: lipid-binding SYLF domain-containing protein [Steroidobacteraceae bacterium]